ncbi:MAG: fibronectin type III domain-containing protein [Candidatus Adiutrix sp.]
MKIFSPSSKIFTFIGLSLVLFLVLALTSCGVKTPPYPTSATLPGPVLALNQTITPQGKLIITFRAPRVNMVGRPLASLGGFEIEMSENILNENYCPTCPHRYEKIDIVPPLPPPPGLALNPNIYEWQYQLTPGHVYRFRVVALSKNRGKHPEAKEELVVWFPAAVEPLKSFSATLGHRAVILNWRPPATTAFSVEVEKKQENTQWQALAAALAQVGQYLDVAVSYETVYYYRARLVHQIENSLVPGPWSPEIAVKVINLVAPNPPAYLDAALGAARVRLSWESMFYDPNLAFYRLYRKLSGEDDFALLTETRENIFTDTPILETGLKAYYYVTAVDNSSRANESAPSPIAEVLLEP